MIGNRRTVVGKGAHFVGAIKAETTVTVSGKVEGNVECGKLIITHDGHILGSVDAKRVVIDGKLDGPVRCEDIIIKSRAQIIGDISCQTLAIDKGARIEGTLAFAVSDPSAVRLLPKDDTRDDETTKSLNAAENCTRMAELTVDARHASGKPNLDTKEALSFLARRGNREAKRLLRKSAGYESHTGTQSS
jgi:cytoskeletal protein CcmA (bactofilin family)